MTGMRASQSKGAARHTAEIGKVFIGKRFWLIFWPLLSLNQLHERGQVGYATRNGVMMIAENDSKTVLGMASVPNRKSRSNSSRQRMNL